MRLRVVETTVAAHLATAEEQVRAAERRFELLDARADGIEETVKKHSEHIRDLFVSFGESRVKIAVLIALLTAVGSVAGGVITQMLMR